MPAYGKKYKAAKTANNEPLPDYMRNSIWLGKSAEGKDIRLSLRAANPFGDLRFISLSSVHPILKVGLEQALGFDLFRLRKFTAPGVSEYGGEKVTPPIWWHIMSQIPQAGMLTDVAVAMSRNPMTGERYGQSGTQYSISTPLTPLPYTERETGALKSPRSIINNIKQQVGINVSHLSTPEFAKEQLRQEHARTSATWREYSRRRVREMMGE